MQQRVLIVDDEPNVRLELGLSLVRKILFVFSQARIVEDDHLNGVTIRPKMLVVGLNCFRNISQAIGRNRENKFCQLHLWIAKMGELAIKADCVPDAPIRA